VRWVLDTNVVVSGLLWQGTSYHLLVAIRQQPNIQVYSSPALLEELADVLSRPFSAKRLGMIGQSVRGVLADFVEVVELVEPVDVPRVVLCDPDDDHVLAAASTARADCIVSGDSDLLTLGRYQGISILTVVQALQRIG
jgi:putative PIN family toxin of toxin-antitoxin system